MAVSRRPLRGSNNRIIIDMRRPPEPQPAVRDDEDHLRTPLLPGEQVSALLDDGTSITLTHLADGTEPYRVVVLRMGRQHGAGAQTFVAEDVARTWAKDRTVENFESGSITYELRRQSGRVYRAVKYPRGAE
jgi:hypothetical protein